jgi:hypothetical protein
MQIWVCKMCGRSMIVKKQPTFCYFDRMDTLEQISKKDSEKMGLFLGKAEQMMDDLQDENVLPFIPEFGGDVNYDPFTGKDTKDSLFSFLKKGKSTLHNYQDAVMRSIIYA